MTNTTRAKEIEAMMDRVSCLFNINRLNMHFESFDSAKHRLVVRTDRPGLERISYENVQNQVWPIKVGIGKD